MSYEVEHAKWLKSHLSKRKGKRLEALKRGHGFGNQHFAKEIWWRLFGHFNGLHPEYEVLDWRGQSFYADFIWIIGFIRIVFEIQDFGSHVQNMDRVAYSKELNRGMFMQSLQIIVVYISLDELKNNRELVLSLVRTIITPYLAQQYDNHASIYSKLERDIMFLAIRNNRIVRPAVAIKELGVSFPTLKKHMRQLVLKGKFREIPSGKTQRITQYEFVGSPYQV